MNSENKAQVTTSSGNDANARLGEWATYPENKPVEYGRYLVYRKGCKKMHFETWNNTGWAYNNNDITHWCDVRPPFA